MPNNEQSDIDFQPKTKEYAYSAKAGASKKYGIYLLVGIVILIIILLSALLYLNNSGNINTTATKEQLEEYQTYVKQKGFADALSYSNDSKSWSVEGLYAGYKNNIVDLVTTKGLIKFPISGATGFETIIIVKGSKEEGGGTFRTVGTYKLDKFLQTVTAGKFLQIYYTKLSNKDIITTRVIYYPDLK